MSRSDELRGLLAGAGRIGLALDERQAELLLRLVDELETANAKFNLTAIRDRPGMILKHVLDSLSLQPYLRGARMADVGTGAGFPGLPLAVVNPERRFALIEATGKKARHVAAVARNLGLGNVEVVHSRAEAHRPAEPYDVVMARALSSLADFVTHAGHLCDPEGRLLAMKGKRPDEELAAVPKTYRVIAVHRLELPGLDAERHLVELSPARASSGRRAGAGRQPTESTP